MTVHVTEKTCSRCRQVKPIEEFYKMKKRYQGYCKPCTHDSFKTYYAQNTQRINAQSREANRRLAAADKDYNLRTRLRQFFRLTLEEYQARVAEQGGACIVCGRIPKKRLEVDHDRDCCPGNKTCGQCIRGLLCSGCNGGTGIVDNPDLLRKKAAYLMEWRARHAATGTGLTRAR